MFSVKVASIDVINHPLKYGGKKLRQPVCRALMLLNFSGNQGCGLGDRTKLFEVSN